MRRIPAMTIVMLTTLLVFSSAAEDKNARRSGGAQKVLGSPPATYLNINNISTVLRNEGTADIDMQQQNGGLVYPKGSRKTAVFQTGFLWGAQIPGDPQVRVGGSAFRSGLQPGKILPSGLPEDPDLPKNRIYRVRTDYRTADLSSEIRDEGGTASAIRAQYELDWNEWPAADGAPYFDRDSNGVYNPAVDIPGVKGADQTVWFVANDLNSTNTQNLYGTQPMGIEVQFTIWAYAQEGALGNMLFKKYLLINKGTLQLDSMFVCQWSDVDDGNATDDFAGSDTTLSMAYVYNGANVDATYNPLPPPAVGFDFFQGPVIPSPADSGIFLGQIRHGVRNLPMTAAFYFTRGDPSVTDPTQGTPAGATQFYNFFRGRIGLTGQPFTDPSGVQTSFALAGDPVTGRGWVDGQLQPPGDRRIGMASGPFTMVPQDTQEIVVAEIVAGAVPGVSRLAAIGLLKFFDKSAQLAYDNFFQLPSPPPRPNVSVTELDREVLLNWANDLESVHATESSDNRGFRFQGYNVYQLPSASSAISDGARVAVFDIAGDAVTRITDQAFDPSSGVVISKLAQFGTDSGIKRFLSIRLDALNGNAPLINGIRYYYAVTAYSYNPDPNVVPNNLENPLSIITVVPHSSNPGVRYQAAYGDTLHNITHTGGSDGTATPLVVDPARVTGHSYRVSFDTATVMTEHGPEVHTTWNLTNTTTNTVLLHGQSNQSGDDDYPVVDGLQVKVAGPPPGMKDFQIPGGQRRWTFSNADGFGMEGFSGAMGMAFNNWLGTTTITPDMLHNVLFKLAATDTNGNLLNSTDTTASFGYRYMRGATLPAARPEFAPFILNPTAGYAFQIYERNMPFAAYDAETGRRLMIGYLENNVAGGRVDGKYWPDTQNGPFSNTDANGPREWFFVFNVPYSETPDPALQVDILNNEVPMMWFCAPNRRGDVPFSAGDEFLIEANHLNTPADEFAFTAPTVVNDPALARVDVSLINVFPNPYYGVNTEELNKYQRFVTFNHLPRKATIRIFNLAGVNVRTIYKETDSQFERWDLANESGLPVGSGLYIAHVDMPELGATKILKLAIVQEQQILDRF
jgi:hypothetical protein